MSFFDDKTNEMEADIEALWFGMPEEARNKIDKLPEGIRDFYLQLARQYALSAYKLGARKERRDCQRAIQKVAEKFHPDNDLDYFLNPMHGDPWA